jgi:hypothetical protein
VKAWIIFLLRYAAFRLGMEPSAASCIGKRVLVGITFKDRSGDLIEQFQMHGRIARISSSEGIVLTKSDGGEFILPPNIGFLQPARPGMYTQRSDGRVVNDPDFSRATDSDRSS